MLGNWLLVPQKVQLKYPRYAPTSHYIVIVRFLVRTFLFVLITRVCSDTNGFDGLISVAREESFPLRSWLRVAYYFQRFNLGVYRWNNGIDCGSSSGAQSSGVIAVSSIKYLKFLSLWGLLKISFLFFQVINHLMDVFYITIRINPT